MIRGRFPARNRRPGQFKQRLNMKSLERGGHLLGLDSSFQWVLDPTWEPRVLWKQERPNFVLMNAAAQISDLKNVRSRRVLRATAPTGVAMDNYSTDDASRGNYFAGLFNQSPKKFAFKEHVLDFVVEQTLGFANDAYAPDVDSRSLPPMR